jgi:hypothetical protein
MSWLSRNRLRSLQPFGPILVIEDGPDTNQKSTEMELASKLALCRRLARDFPSGVTGDHLRQLAIEIELKISAFKE